MYSRGIKRYPHTNSAANHRIKNDSGTNRLVIRSSIKLCAQMDIWDRYILKIVSTSILKIVAPTFDTTVLMIRTKAARENVYFMYIFLSSQRYERKCVRGFFINLEK